MNLLYLLSGKNGITSFTYKELELLENNGVNLVLLFTQLQNGNLSPKKSWKKIVFKPLTSILNAVLNFYQIIFLKSFYESFKHKELKYFITAFYFKKKLFIKDSSHIHVQMGDHKLIIGYYLSKMIGHISLSTTIHAHELYSEYRYSKETRYRYLLNCCSKVFTISNFNREILKNEIKIPESKIEIMYLYPSFEKFDFKNKIKILITGNWERKKGHEDLLNALVNLNRNDYVLLIAGKNVNPEKDLNLTELIEEKSLEKKALILGHINKNALAFFYSYCDLFILPSKTDYYKNGKVKEREGIPVAIMEAMNYGLPVISTIHAGIPEALDNFLIEEGNIVELTATLNKVLDDINRIKSESSINIDKVKAKFNPDNIRVFIEYLQKNNHVQKK